MIYQHVDVASIGYVLPPVIVTSAQIEAQLAPLYERLRLPAGRLELMSGIGQRRLWAAGTLPSEMSIRSGELALAAAGIDRQTIGLLIHASVCRDHLEPATACRVHHGLGLPPETVIYDVSNACLGILNGMLQAANMIELGLTQAALVVGTESSRPLLETTISHLNRDCSLTRQTVKSAVASLTIGSASCAVLLTRRDAGTTPGSPHRSRLVCATARAHSQHHQLCQSGCDEAVADGMRPLMETDSETLLRCGIETATSTFDTFLRTLGDSRQGLHKTICHQVGSAHRRALLEALQINEQLDFATYSWLGNTGSAALPVSLAIAAEQQHLARGDRVGLLGIGSGINCLMVAVDWEQTAIRGEDLSPAGKSERTVDG